MAEDSDSKTEEPTDKKLADAMESGDVPMSREVTFLAALTAYVRVFGASLGQPPDFSGVMAKQRRMAALTAGLDRLERIVHDWSATHG